MTQYNFHNFDDYDFELLCRDLLNEDQRVNVKYKHGFDDKPFILNFNSYKRGKDKGIDLHCVYEKENIEVIGQVKLSRGKFQDVFYSIKRKVGGKNELNKVQELNPSKYVFMTSVPLSHENKRVIMDFFSPYIIRIEDIYGLEDLNKLIGQFEHIEKRYLKLYFHSPLILERLQNKATLSKSLFVLDKIIDQLPFFVQTSHFAEALSILENHRILIIKGAPGSGKTTIAEILALHFTFQDYQFVAIEDLDNEIERLLDTDEKTIYYYDDFLGANTLIIKDALKNDAKLNRLIRRISSSKNKYLVLTSRTTIINNVKYASEKLRRLFEIIQKFEVNLDNLNIQEKELIVNRHIDRNQIPKDAISEELLRFILDYKTFSPRLIQFITDRFLSNKDNYDEFVRNSILFPDEIWKYAYQNEINFTCQLFLNHLFLFGSDYDSLGYKTSFENRLIYETKINNFLQTGFEFGECMEKLEDAFISLESYLVDQDELGHRIKFFNPSIVDFFLKEIKNNSFIIKNSIRCFDNPDLLTNRFNHQDKDLLRLFTQSELEDILLRKDANSLDLNLWDRVSYLKALKPYFSSELIEQYYHEMISKCLDLEFLDSILFDYLSFLSDYKDTNVVRTFIDGNLNAIAIKLFKECSYENEFMETIEFFELLGYNINKLVDNIDFDIFNDAFINIVNDTIDQYIYVKTDYVSSQEDVEKILDEMQNKFAHYKRYHLDTDLVVSKKIEEVNWAHIIDYNKSRYSGKKI